MDIDCVVNHLKLGEAESYVGGSPGTVSPNLLAVNGYPLSFPPTFLSTNNDGKGAVTPIYVADKNKKE